MKINHSLPVLFGLLLSFSAPAQESSSEASPKPAARGPTQESRGARIRNIHILIGDVFATDTPEEDKSFFRLANSLHIETRDSVVRRQLLFKEGDAYVDRLIRESERILRRNRYFFDASIVPIEVPDGVDLEVRTRDVWTFKPGIQFGRSGGENSTGFELQESNLLGYGKEVTVAHKTNVDRTTDEFRYFDPQLLGSRSRLYLSHSSNSDGKREGAILDRPFYSLDTPWSAAANLLDWERTDQRYLLGKVADEFRHRQESYSLNGGVSRGLQGNWVRRYTFGTAFTQDRFASTGTALSALNLPVDRKFVYPYLGVTVFENKYEERRNENQIERTEDLFAGKYFQASLGWAGESIGSDDNAAFLTLGAGDTLETADRRHTLVLQSDANARIQGGDLVNAMLTGVARYYWRVGERQLFFASLSGSITDRLDADRQLTLGGDSGLRGYPLRYQEGASAALLTIEHRVYTKYYLFRLFHLGGAVFADVGRTWGRGTVSTGLGPSSFDTNLGLLKDVGFGLRFGSSRSAFGNVIHVDVAFPLDGDNTIDRMQFLVESKTSF